MASATVGEVMRQLGRLFTTGATSGLEEAQLLERFAQARDEIAFQALVARHGPMVLGVCRRLVDDPHAVEDAFQATFLVLVRRAGSIRDPARLGPWLYGVAHRVARRARADLARQRRREQGGDALIAHEPASTPASEGTLGPELHEELNRLPRAYRDVVVLCDLEGQTHEEAARALKWPIGTVKGRLFRARAALRQRLTRRGITLSAVALTAVLEREAHAIVAPALLNATVRAAMGLAAGGSIVTSGLVSAGALGWAEGTTQAMFWTKIKAVAAILTVGTVTTTGVLGYQRAGAVRDDVGSIAGRAAQDEAKSAAAVSTDRPASEAPTPEGTVVETARRKLAEAERLLNAANAASRVEQAEATFHSLLQTIQNSLNRRDLPKLRDGLTQARQGSRGMIVIECDPNPGDKAHRAVALERHRARMESLQSIIASGKGLPDPQSVAEVARNLAEAELWIAEAEAGRPLTGFEPPPPPSPNLASGSGPDVGHAPGGPLQPPPDAGTQAILDALEKSVPMNFRDPTPIEDVLNYIKVQMSSEQLPNGAPIYVDPFGMQAVERTPTSPIEIDLEGVPLKMTLRLVLNQLDLIYKVEQGVLIITSKNSRLLDELEADDVPTGPGPAATGSSPKATTATPGAGGFANPGPNTNVPPQMMGRGLAASAEAERLIALQNEINQLHAGLSHLQRVVKDPRSDPAVLKAQKDLDDAVTQLRELLGRMKERTDALFPVKAQITP